MVATDGFGIAVAFVVAYLVRFGAQPPSVDLALLIGVAPLVVIGIFAGLHLYSAFRLATAEEFRRLIWGISVGITLIATASFWLRSSLPRMWIGLSWALSVALVVAGRRWWHHWIAGQRARGKLTFRTLVVGTNEEAEHLADVIRGDSLGFAPLGFVATGCDTNGGGELPVVGEIDRLREAIRETRADCVFVASSALSADQMRRVGRSSRLEGVEFRVSANLLGTHSTRISAQPLGGVMTLSVRPVRLSGFQAVVKRTLDVVGSSLVLLATLPAFAVIACAIRLNSRGPVLYRQVRLGRHLGAFTLLKFRTMVANADELRDGLRSRNEASAPLFKVRDDPRVSTVGRWLRRWSLDELPQLVNVLKGDMSLVGPRPPLPPEVARYEEWHLDRLEVRPGITGLWQVSGRSDTSFDDYVRLDLFYIENWSPAYDLFILAKTLPAVLSGRGSY